MKRLPQIFTLVCTVVMISVMLCGCGMDTDIAAKIEKPDFGAPDEPDGTGNNDDESGRNDDQKKEEEMENGDNKSRGELKVMDSDALSKGVNAFNWAYYDIQDHKRNLFYSPLSLAEALSMALYGAEGSTEEELKNVLNISDTDTFISDLNAFAKAEYGDANSLVIANSLWTDKTFTKNNGIKEDFIKGLEEKLDAEVKEADFANDSEDAAKEISEWVEEKTDGFIPDYESIANENTVLDIINAIYFNGRWETEFMKEDTFEEIFRGEKEGPVELMHLYDESFKYIEKDGFKGLELPYKESSLAMDLILPEGEDDIECGSKWAGLSDDEKEEFLSELCSAEFRDINNIGVPKFDMDITAPDLKKDLEKLGIKSAFDPSAADFSGIAEDMYVSEISHRARIKVDEEGSRAAAVTEMEMAVTAIAPNDEYCSFVCDRPFVYVIKDRSTGVILFTGLVNSL